MERKMKKNSMIKTQILVYLILGLTNIFANKSSSTNSNPTPSAIEAKVGNEKTNIRKVKIVPIKEILSLSNPIKRIGKARIQPHIYKNGINLIVVNNFGPKKISFRNNCYSFGIN